MTTALLHPLWPRHASMKPRLRGGIRVRRQRYRGEPWMLLIDGVTRRVHRLDADAWALVGRCNGDRTVQAIWETLLDLQGDDAPTQAEVIELLGRLDRAGVLQAPVDAAAPAAQPPARVTAVHPLQVRVALGDPSRLLAALARRLRPLLQPALPALAGLGLLAAALVALAEADALLAHARTWLASPFHLGLMWLVWPVMKLLHELAHGLAVHRFGGEVREAGVTLAWFTPLPWVDASAAGAIADRRARALVSLAGILTELVLAALALAVWRVAQDGLVRDLAFATMFTGAVSGLLVNGNPLVRLDGYHAMCDLLDLPNLASRSARWWLAAWSRLLQGADHAVETPRCAPGERPWLIGYAPLSWLVRGALAVGAARALAQAHPALGLAAGLGLAWWLAGRPLAALWARLGSPLLPRRVRGRGRALALGAAGALALAAAGWPLPQAAVAPGVIDLPDEAWLRAPDDGRLDDAAPVAPRPVRAGEVALRLHDERLAAQRAAAAAELAALQVRLFDALAHARADAPGLHRQVEAARGRLDETDRRLGALQVRAPQAGELVPDARLRAPGAWVRRGDTLGHVRPDDNRVVRVALPHEEALRVQQAAGRPIRLRRADRPGEEIGARLRSAAVPAAGHRLPARSLGDRGGGPLVTDPSDPQGLTARDPVAVLELEALAPLGGRIGTRVWVRFDLPPDTAVRQAGRGLRQTFLGRLDPETP